MTGTIGKQDKRRKNLKNRNNLRVFQNTKEKMFIVIAMMFSGIAFGYLMRRHRFTHIGKIIISFIWILLFVLGVEVGGDPKVMNSLHTLGIEAIFIAGISILGSAVAAMLLWKNVKKDEERRKHEG